jgi:hypothetical protein
MGPAMVNRVPAIGGDAALVGSLFVHSQPAAHLIDSTTLPR